MFTVTADPTTAFADAFKAVLVADAALLLLVTGVFGHVSEAARVAYPYLVLGRSAVDGNAGAMQLPGHLVSLQLDGWSDAGGPYAIEQIGSRVFGLMERRPGFVVPGFAILEGSLHREFAEVFDEPDEDKPDGRLYRTTQRWTVEIHGAL